MDARSRRVMLTVALVVNGAPAGEVPVETDQAGDAAVNVEQLLARLDAIVDRNVIEDIIERAAGREIVPLGELRSERFAIEFNVATLQLAVVIPTSARALSSVSIVNRAPSLINAATPPEDVAAGLTVFLGQRFFGGRRFEFDREPFTAIVEGFANVGGIDGVYLKFLSGYEEGGVPVRGRTTLFHDDVDRAIRYAVGDIDPQSFASFQPAPSILGFGVERLYQDIQPYRNLRPSGRGALELDRPSRVDVLVNGTIYRTLSLQPGRYDLRDFPFLDGLNDVRLVVQDDAGRTESIVLSFFSDVDLLEEGLSIFSATIGFPRSRFGSFVNSDYRDEPTFNGFYQVGLSDRLTVGGSVQADRRNALVGALAVVGTPIGTFGFEGALDASSREGLQGAALANYRISSPSSTGQLRSLDAEIRYQTAGYSPMFAAGAFRTPYSFEASLRVQSPIAENLYATLAAGYRRGRGATRDLKTATIGLTRTFGRVIVTANYVYLDDPRTSDHRGLFSISIPLSTRQSVRGSYDTFRNRARLDYDLQGFEELNSTRGRVSVGRNDLGEEAFVDVEHFSNRFRASARHDYSTIDGPSRHVTDLAVTFGLGYADGRLALGREAGRGFVIVDGHPTLGDVPISVTSRSTLGPVARADSLGPALVPLQRGYRAESLEVEIEELRPGYDIGPGRLDIIPGAASGYRWTIGSAASNFVIGQLVRPDGEPLEFFSGTLQPIEGPEAVAVPFFTNRTGRMVAQHVAPGRYSIVPAGGAASIGEVVVPENATGPVEIGVITVEGVEQ